MSERPTSLAGVSTLSARECAALLLELHEESEDALSESRDALSDLSMSTTRLAVVLIRLQAALGLSEKSPETQ